MFESLQSLAKGLFSIRAIQGLSYTVHTCTWASLGNFFVHLVPHFKSRNDVLHCALWLRCILTMLLSLFLLCFVSNYIFMKANAGKRKKNIGMKLQCCYVRLTHTRQGLSWSIRQSTVKSDKVPSIHWCPSQGQKNIHNKIRTDPSHHNSYAALLDDDLVTGWRWHYLWQATKAKGQGRRGEGGVCAVQHIGEEKTPDLLTWQLINIK